MRSLFKNRTEAALLLAEKLQWLKEEGQEDSLLVLAIPRGGVVTGDIIATSLGVNLDVVVAKKIGHPSNPEFAIGAVMHDGSFISNEAVVSLSDVPHQYLKDSISILTREIDRRLKKFRGSKVYDLSGKVVVLVDDGIATGMTMFAAIKWLKTQQLRGLIVAIPVGPRDTIQALKEIVDEVIVLHSPAIFGVSGLFMKTFRKLAMMRL